MLRVWEQSQKDREDLEASESLLLLWFPAYSLPQSVLPEVVRGCP